MGKHHGQNNAIAVSNYVVDFGKQADLSQEFCLRLSVIWG